MMADSNKVQEGLLRKIYCAHDGFLVMARDLEPSFDDNSRGIECKFEQEARLSLYRQALKVVNYIEAYRENFWADEKLREIENELGDYLKDEDSKIVTLLSHHENIVRITDVLFENRLKISSLIDKIINELDKDSQKNERKNKKIN